MGIAILALAMIPNYISVIAVFVGIILIIIGKKKDKKGLLIGGRILLIIGVIVVVLYHIFLYGQVFMHMFLAWNVMKK